MRTRGCRLGVGVRLAVLLLGEDTIRRLGFRALAAATQQKEDQELLHVSVPNLCQLVNAALTLTSTATPNNQINKPIQKIANQLENTFRNWQNLADPS